MSILAKLTDLVENHPQTQEDFNRRFHETYLMYKHNDDDWYSYYHPHH